MKARLGVSPCTDSRVSVELYNDRLESVHSLEYRAHGHHLGRDDADTEAVKVENQFEGACSISYACTGPGSLCHPDRWNAVAWIPPKSVA